MGDDADAWEVLGGQGGMVPTRLEREEAVEQGLAELAEGMLCRAVVAARFSWSFSFGAPVSASWLLLDEVVQPLPLRLLQVDIETPPLDRAEHRRGPLSVPVARLDRCPGLLQAGGVAGGTEEASRRTRQGLRRRKQRFYSLIFK